MMRIRLLSLALALMLVFPVAAFAELNLADYSLEDLIALKTQIQAEITTRTAGSRLVRVPMGTYTVGVDIPAGTYTLTGASDVAMIVLYSAEGKITESHRVDYQDTVGKINLLDGQIVEVTFGDIVFSTYKGLGF